MLEYACIVMLMKHFDTEYTHIYTHVPIIRCIVLYLTIIVMELAKEGVTVMSNKITCNYSTVLVTCSYRR